jgi:hypothetical protein
MGNENPGIINLSEKFVSDMKILDQAIDQLLNSRGSEPLTEEDIEMLTASFKEGLKRKNKKV